MKDKEEREPYSGGPHFESENESHGCSMVTKGFCEQHGVQEERREADRNRLNDLQRDFKEYKKTNNVHVSNLCTFKNRVVGCSLLGVMVLGGSFAYTYTSNVSGGVIDQNVVSKLDSVISDVSTNKVNTAVLVSQLQTTNDRLGEVINLMNEQLFEDRKGRNK